MDAGAADLAGQRAEIDDPPEALATHHRERGGAAVKRAGEVDRDDLVPVLGRSVWDADHAHDAGAVDPELQRTGLGPGALGQREHRLPVGDIEFGRRQARAARLDRRDVGAEDRKALRKEGCGQRSAEVARGAGDDRGRHHLLSCAGAMQIGVVPLRCIA